MVTIYSHAVEKYARTSCSQFSTFVRNMFPIATHNIRHYNDLKRQRTPDFPIDKQNFTDSHIFHSTKKQTRDENYPATSKNNHEQIPIIFFQNIF